MSRQSKSGIVTRAVLLGAILTAGLAAWPAQAEAQYFGRNKVQYDRFDFKVLKTEHFDIYYYTEEADAAAQVGRMAERWYMRLSRCSARARRPAAGRPVREPP